MANLLDIKLGGGWGKVHLRITTCAERTNHDLRVAVCGLGKDYGGKILKRFMHRSWASEAG